MRGRVDRMSESSWFENIKVLGLFSFAALRPVLYRDRHKLQPHP